jgi:mannose-1-phosphate guanylyltransferase/phosphomannomutase
MILAAGKGERLRPITLERPKPLIPVANRPLIEYNLHLLKQYGVDEVAINLHYMGDKIKEHLGDGRRFGLSIVYSEEAVLLGTGGGIRKMSAFLEEDTFLVINADILIDIDLQDVLAFHRSKGAFATMVLRPNPDPVRYGTIETNESGRICEFLGKVRTGQTGLKKWMFTGIHVMEPKVIEFMPDQETFCINRDVYAQWIRSEKPCYGYIHGGYWRDLGSMEDYLQANIDLMEAEVLKNPFADTEVTDVKTGENVVVTPPCLIGEGAVLDNGAEIGSGTIIGERSEIGAGSKITKSVLWPGVRIEDHAKIEGMIVTPYQRIQTRTAR